MRLNFTSSFRLFLIYFLFFTSGAVAQTSYPISTICNTGPGLKNDFLADNQNVKWIATNSGVRRYDGTNCDVINTTTSPLVSNVCYSLAQDHNGRIWIGTSGGISVYDGTSWSTISSANSPLTNNTIYDLALHGSVMWIATGDGLYNFDGTNWNIFKTSNSGLISNVVKSLAVSTTGIYVGTDNGLSFYSGNNWTNWFPGQNGLFSGPIERLLFSGGRLWTNAQFLENGAFISIWEFVNNENATSDTICNECVTLKWIFADNTGNTYFADYGNLFKVKPDLSVSATWLGNTGFANGDFDSNNTLWFASATGTLKYVSDTDLKFGAVAYIRYTEYDQLDKNKVRALLLNRGDMHWDPVGQTPYYEVPKGSNKVPVYCSALWLGGLDQNGLLHTAAHTYRQQGGEDFYTGPLDTISGLTDSVTSAYYDRFWKIDREMIEKFRYNFRRGNVQNGTFRIPEAIATWPAHATGNYSRKMAPFIDANGDGVYNPYDGDYPELTGHQMLWWVFNDTLRRHSETFGTPFQFEIHAKAYAFNCDENPSADEVMNYTTFYQFKIINRSQNNYHDMYAGIWTDFDLGNASDDYIGCDSSLNSFFAYNGDNIDDGGGGYGLNPPMMSVTILQGPQAPANDNYDNNHNGITDEPGERIGMSNFLTYIGANNIIYSNPDQASDYYNYLRSIWQDGRPMTIGGRGIDLNGVLTNYQYHTAPYEPIGWNMVNAGILPDDVRGVGSSGPFTIAPNEEQTFDFAYIFTRDSLNPNGLNTSVAKNKADVQKVIDGFNAGNYPCRSSFVSEDPDEPFDFTIYPNPVQNNLFINWQLAGSPYEIYSYNGQLVRTGTYSFSGIPVEDLASELYLLRVTKDSKSHTKRFIKISNQ